jgi:hypothetical protein
VLEILPDIWMQAQRANIYQKSMRTELSSIIHSLPVLEILPDIWMQEKGGKKKSQNKKWWEKRWEKMRTDFSKCDCSYVV